MHRSPLSAHVGLYTVVCTRSARGFVSATRAEPGPHEARRQTLAPFTCAVCYLLTVLVTPSLRSRASAHRGRSAMSTQRGEGRGGVKSTCATGARCSSTSPWVRFGRASNLMTGGGGRFGASWRFGGDEGRRGRPLALPLPALATCSCWSASGKARNSDGDLWEESWVSVTELTPVLVRVFHEITSARTPASSPLRAAAVLLARVLRAFEILGASGKRPPASRVYRRLRAPCPPDWGVCSPTITPSGIGSAPRALWCLTRRGYIHPSPAALNR